MLDEAGGFMGTVYASITLSNPRDEQLKPILVRALVDTGTMYLSLSRKLRQLRKLIGAIGVIRG
jgi:hypothetical protein